MLLTTDMMVEDVHFDLSWTTPFQLGFKLVSVNVSDIYAMGGKPKFLLLNFSAGKRYSVGFFLKIIGWHRIGFETVWNFTDRRRYLFLGKDRIISNGNRSREKGSCPKRGKIR